MALGHAAYSPPGQNGVVPVCTQMLLLSDWLTASTTAPMIGPSKGRHVCGCASFRPTKPGRRVIEEQHSS